MGHTARRIGSFLLPLLALIAVIAILDPTRVRAVLVGFSPRSLGIVLVVLLARELIKAARWSYFLHAAGLGLTPRDGAANFLAGQAVGALPLGEVLRGRLLREHGVPAYEVIPVFAAQIACDVTAYVLIALLGASRGIITWWLAVVPLMLPMLLAVVLSSKRVAAAVGRFLRRHRMTAPFAPIEADLHAHTLRLFRSWVLLWGTLSGGAVSLAAAVVLVTLVGDLSRSSLGVNDALVAHALSTLAGTISLVPGGWGVTDGSLGGLLKLFGVSAAVALSVALVYRFLDVIFRTFLGMLVLFARYRSLFGDDPPGSPERLPHVPTKSIVAGD